MKEHPILFNTEMVRAILAGRKTVTRRIVKFPSDFDGKEVFSNGRFGLKYTSNKFEGAIERLNPKWEIGDILWVKETFYELNKVHYPDLPHKILGDKVVYYAASFDRSTGALRKKPSLFMSKDKSRIKLEITDVRVEKLQEITEEQATYEGVEENYYGNYKSYASNLFLYDYAIESFKTLWESINGKDSWSLNPYVWVIEFKVIQQPC